MTSNKWKTYQIGDLGKVVTGKTPPTKDKENFDGAYPFITPVDMNGQKNIYTTNRSLSESGKFLMKNFLLPPKTVCVSCIGSDLGKVVKTTKESFTNQQINSIICNNHFDADFIYYAIINISSELKNIGHQSTAVPIINKTDFSLFEICAPDNKEAQIRISSILSSLDEKIELNQQINNTLEEIAKSTFQKLCMPKSNEVPVGWHFEKLGETVEFIKGVSYRSSELVPSIFALVTLKSINRRGGLNFDGFKEFNGTYKETQVLLEGDVVIPQTDITQNADLVGSPAIVENPFNYEKLIASIDIVKCKPKKKDFSNYILYYFLQQQSFKDYCLSHTNGSTVLHLRSSELPNYEFIMPDTKTLIEFNRLVKPIREKIILNNQESLTLRNIRNVLLPRLMKGEIPV